MGVLLLFLLTSLLEAFRMKDPEHMENTVI